MFKNVFNQTRQYQALLRLLLVFVLVFAAIHVSFHDFGPGNSNEECQVCRLSHAPGLQLAAATPLVCLLITIALLPVAAIQTLCRISPRPWHARAPPLF